jgi:exopolyphosphatase/guanosine-5'-triphosphate,3'-diphosphate pyrophosphatase
MGSDQSTKVKASIDIGSNTVLLLVGKVQKGRVIPLNEQQAAPRLGKGVDAEKSLDPDAVQRVIEAILEFKSFLSCHYPEIEDAKVMATSAVRDAENKEAFVERIEKETGYKTRILSGNEEAKLMFQGAKSVLPGIRQSATVIDIGGGSTEFATGTGEMLKDYVSLNMGSVRFTERYLSGNPPSQEEIGDSRQAVKQMLRDHSFHVEPETTLIGIAGTVTSLASIDAGLETYQPEKLNGYQLELAVISRYIIDFANQTKEQLLARYPHILKGRAGVILCGLIILETWMKYYDVHTLATSTGGIRHGALI